MDYQDEVRAETDRRALTGGDRNPLSISMEAYENYKCPEGHVRCIGGYVKLEQPKDRKDG